MHERAFFEQTCSPTDPNGSLRTLDAGPLGTAWQEMNVTTRQPGPAQCYRLTRARVWALLSVSA